MYKIAIVLTITFLAGCKNNTDDTALLAQKQEIESRLKKEKSVLDSLEKRRTYFENKADELSRNKDFLNAVFTRDSAMGLASPILKSEINVAAIETELSIVEKKLNN